MRNSRSRPAGVRIALAIVAAMALAAPVHAQWKRDGVGGGIAAGIQSQPAMASDGANGAIVVWTDSRTGSADIYAQRVDARGVTRYADITGHIVCGATGTQSDPQIIPDGTGGAIVVWTDNRSTTTDIYAQRMDAAGLRLWGPNGVAVCTAAGNQALPELVSDDAGGAIIVWEDLRGGATKDVYAQRVNGAGAAQWTANGVGLSTAAGNQDRPRIVRDGAGGAIVAWEDHRFASSDIYGQRVSAAGAAQWAANGTPLCTVTNNQVSPVLTADGAGGAIIAWQDFRGVDADLYVQRVTATGVTMWSGGIAMCTAAGTQAAHVITSDGAGGAILAWEDLRGADTDVYAQRVTATGQVPWPENGVVVSLFGSDQYRMAIAPDGTGGAIVTWTVLPPGGLHDIMAQRVSATGMMQWAQDGVPVCSAASYQVAPAIAIGADGAAIIAWQDYRSMTSNTDVYVQRVEPRFGAWGSPEPLLDAVADIPLDQGGRVAVRWHASGRDVLGATTISHYSVWRAADAVGAAAAKRAGAPLIGIDAVTADFRGPALRANVALGADSYWELAGTATAAALGAYAFTTTTTYDSTAQGPAVHHFQVVAHDAGSAFVHWPSNVVTGWSVDNLVPAAPLFLTAQRSGPDVVLRWNRVASADLRDYAVYRAPAPGVVPLPAHFLASAGDTMLVDAGAPGSALHYVVTAVDLHENHSTPSNEAAVVGVTGATGGVDIPTLTMLPNRPNPFRSTTEVAFGLPAAGDVAIELLDLAGRRVRALAIAGAAAGWHRIALTAVGDDGRPLAGGVYFCRLTAAGATATRRLVVAR